MSSCFRIMDSIFGISTNIPKFFSDVFENFEIFEHCFRKFQVFGHFQIFWNSCIFF